MDSRIVRICSAGDQLSRYPVSLCAPSWHVPPHTLQHIKADAPQLVDVGVEDFGQEADLGWRHRVVIGEEQLEFEDAA